MADKKISALTSATTPLAGTEVLPIVQGASTVKVPVSDLTAGRAVSATSLTASTGNVIIGTANQGVDFSANTNAAGMTSEILNWYEVGTFTPVFGAQTVDPTVSSYSTQYGSYTRIGNRVFITVNLLANLSSAGTGAPTIKGLPYAANASCLNGATFGLRTAFLIFGSISFVSGNTFVLSDSTYATGLNVYCTFSLMYEV